MAHILVPVRAGKRKTGDLSPPVIARVSSWLTGRGELTGLPARLDHPGKLAFVGALAELVAAEPEIAVNPA